jgi:hypothetical protein
VIITTGRKLSDDHPYLAQLAVALIWAAVARRSASICAPYPMPGLGRSLCAVALLSCLSWRDVRGGLPPGELHSSHKHAHAQAQDQQIEHHLRGRHEPGGLAECGDVTEAHDGEYGHREVQRVGAGERVLKLAGFAFAMVT